MKTLIQNGTIVTADSEYKADILIIDEKISAVGALGECGADEIIDASGKYVFPGGVDQHTHFDALCNSGNKDTAAYESTDSVIVGGTTTIVDFAPQDPGSGLIDSIEYRINRRAKDKICVDFALHSLVTNASDSIFDEIPHLGEYGVPSIKLFMAYKGSPLYADDGMLYQTLTISKKYGISVFVHAENAELISRFQKNLISEGKTAPKYHAPSRPSFVEGEATQRAIYLAKAADAPLFVVHMSCKEAVDAVREARAHDLPVYGESVTHHLTLTEKELDRPDFEGAKYVCSPPLRTQAHIDALWEGIQNNWIKAVASDHCGIDWKELKHFGIDDFTMIPNGSPGAADRVHMVWTNGVEKGKINRQKFVDIISTAPAKINGIYPRKGHIGAGSDADIVIFDPRYRGIVRFEDNPNGVDYNVYEGMEQIGRCETVLLRGQVAVKDGKFIGKRGKGQFIPGKTYGACYSGF